MEPKISVIIPVYNVEKYLDRCIKSVMNQTFKDIEIIIVDDGSQDACSDKCDEYAKLDCRVKVIHQVNQGAGFARNTGIKEAQGEYVAFIDSDDYIDYSMLEKLYYIANKENLDACSCGIRNINNDLLLYDQYDYPEYKILINNEECREMALELLRGKSAKISSNLYQRHRMAVWHTIFKLSVIKLNKIFFPSERKVFSEDLAFNFSFFTCANRVGFIPDIMVYHCYNSDSLTATRVKTNVYPKLKQQLQDLKIYMVNKKYNEYQIDSLRLFFVNYIISIIRVIVKSEKNKDDSYKKIKTIVEDDVSWKFIKKGSFVNRLKWHRRFLLCLIYSRSIFTIRFFSQF